MVQKNTMLFFGLGLATLIGFILKSLSKYNSDSESANPIGKLTYQATFVILTLIMWGVLIFN
jgi:hypothetical protein